MKFSFYSFPSKYVGKPQQPIQNMELCVSDKANLVEILVEIWFKMQVWHVAHIGRIT